MAGFDPIENSLRIRRGLLSLISGAAIKFSNESNPLIVVFDGPVTKFSGGKILLFQQLIEDRVGVTPEIVKQIPACIKVFFHLEADEYQKKQIEGLLQTQEFLNECASISVKQIQYRSKLYRIG